MIGSTIPNVHVATASRRTDSRRKASVARASLGEDAGFPGFFSKRIEEGKKVLKSVTSEIGDAHKKNIEKLDSIAKEDVELAKWILDGSKTDIEEIHKKNVEYLDELSKRDVEFAKKMLNFSKETPESSVEVIDVKFDET